MKEFIRRYNKYLLGVGLLFFSIILVRLLFILSPKPHSPTSVLAQAVHKIPSPTQTPTQMPTPILLPSIVVSTSPIKGESSVLPTSVSTQSIQTTPAVSPTQAQNHLGTNSLQSSPVPPTSSPQITAQPSPTPTITPQVTIAAVQVTLHITDPDGTKIFQVTLHTGDTLCDNLVEAKNEGKIKSLTLDNSYMQSFHSAYVREMDGFTNNWTVSVNNTSPQGCSLYTVKPNDSIIWKFL